MPGTYCSFEPEHGEAVLIITNLTNGDTMSPCAVCVRPFLATMVQEMGFDVTDQNADTDPGGEPDPGDGEDGPEPAPGEAETAGEPQTQPAGPDGPGQPDNAAESSAGPDPAVAHESMQAVTGGLP